MRTILGANDKIPQSLKIWWTNPMKYRFWILLFLLPMLLASFKATVLSWPPSRFFFNFQQHPFRWHLVSRSLSNSYFEEDFERHMVLALSGVTVIIYDVIRLEIIFQTMMNIRYLELEFIQFEHVENSISD